MKPTPAHIVFDADGVPSRMGTQRLPNEVETGFFAV